MPPDWIRTSNLRFRVPMREVLGMVCWVGGNMLTEGNLA